MKTKTILQAALIVAAAAPAQAMYRAAAIPSAPLRMPTAVPTRGVALPSYMPVQAVTLPSVMPVSAPALLPSVRIVTPIQRGIGLPGIKLPVVAQMSFGSVQAKPSEKDDSRRAEKLNKLFDQGQDKRRAADRRDDRPHTLPESDLLDEIGVGTYY